MRNTILVIILLLSSVFRTQGQNAQNNQKFDASKVVGTFYYEEDKAIKKIKIREKDLRYRVKKRIINYNSKIKEISFLKDAELKGISTLVNSNRKVTNPDTVRDFRTQIEKVLSPIRDSIKSFEKQLNINLKSELTKKQFRNWLKFQRNEKRKLEPKAPERRNAPSRSRNMNRRRRF